MVPSSEVLALSELEVLALSELEVLHIFYGGNVELLIYANGYDEISFFFAHVSSSYGIE